MSCELNYKTARPLSSLEPMVYTESCMPCKVKTPCKKEKICKKVCEEVLVPAPVSCAPVCASPCDEVVEKCGDRSGWWSIILTFIIVFILAWFLLYSLRPTFVLNTDSNGNVIQPPTVNAGKVVVYSIVIALVACLLIWAFRNSFRY